MKKRVVILSSQEGDWEALYVDGNCINQHHSLERVDGKRNYIMRMAGQYKFKTSDIVYHDATDEDDKIAQDSSFFPETLKELLGNYDSVNEIDDNYE